MPKTKSWDYTSESMDSPQLINVKIPNDAQLSLNEEDS